MHLYIAPHEQVDPHQEIETFLNTLTCRTHPEPPLSPAPLFLAFALLTFAATVTLLLIASR